MDLQTVEALYNAFVVHQDAPRNFDEAMSEPFFTATHEAFTAWANARAEYLATPVPAPQSPVVFISCHECEEPTPSAELAEVSDDLACRVEQGEGFYPDGLYCPRCRDAWEKQYPAPKPYDFYDRAPTRGPVPMTRDICYALKR